MLNVQEKEKKLNAKIKTLEITGNTEEHNWN